jgi:hypothetical protein
MEVILPVPNGAGGNGRDRGRFRGRAVSALYRRLNIRYQQRAASRCRRI